MISGKENRFCYYVGGLEDSATGILNEISKPLSWGMPSEKVCEKLKKKDSQICQLRYGNFVFIFVIFINVSQFTLTLLDFLKFTNRCIRTV